MKLEYLTVAYWKMLNSVKGDMPSRIDMYKYMLIWTLKYYFYACIYLYISLSVNLVSRNFIQGKLFLRYTFFSKINFVVLLLLIIKLLRWETKKGKFSLLFNRNSNLISLNSLHLNGCVDTLITHTLYCNIVLDSLRVTVTLFKQHFPLET